MPKVFISHSWEDNNISKQIASYLKQAGAEVWIDYARISGGDSLPEVIGEAIEWCDTMVLVWSKSAACSYFVKLEWTCGLTNQKRIIPCVVDNTRLPTILSGFLYINFGDGKQDFIELGRALKLDAKTNSQKIKLAKSSEQVLIDTTKNSKTIKSIQPILTKRFRSNPTELSETDVENMLKKNKFFDANWNKEGYGFDNDFILQRQDQVVLDKASSLMWQQSGSPNYMSYEEAKKYIQQLNEAKFADFSDWRLPTLEEAMSLMEPKKKNEVSLLSR